jgi:hypothetical protein
MSNDTKSAAFHDEVLLPTSSSSNEPLELSTRADALTMFRIDKPQQSPLQLSLRAHFCLFYDLCGELGCHAWVTRNPFAHSFCYPVDTTTSTTNRYCARLRRNCWYALDVHCRVH